ncbi:MAG: hypothetical protein K6G64_07080 [Eubacterium sp.]|nr:hypothetical protein [Eubacterium sp.]
MEEKKININEMPKWFRVLLLLTPLIGILLIKTTLDNDFYFLYATGEYIVNHGFPHKDFLSMHSSMDIIVQQWLSTVIYYYVYKLFGKVGVLLLLYICYVIVSYLSLKLSRMITNNMFVSLICVLAADVWIAAMFIVSRPQMFTYIIMLFEMYLLEKFVQEKKIRYLCVLPVLSLLLINLHASMWAMFFVYAMPYFVNALPIKIGAWKQTPCCDYRKLLVAGIVSILPGFLNPYGIKAMLYIFSSFGVPEINDMINEMKATSFENAAGKMFFFLVGVMAVVALMRKKQNRYETRFVLLFAGSLVMALMNYKSHAYFYIFASICFSYMIQDAQVMLKVSDAKRTPAEKKRLVLLAGLFAMTVVIAVMAITTTPQKKKKSEEVVSYNQLDDVMKMIPKSDNVVLYGNFVCGQYLEFHGYHPYIDGRAELFLKANNKEYDYYIEYYKLKKGEMNCKKFLERYQFNYLVVEKERDSFLYNYLIDDNSYKQVYKSKTVNLFTKQ